MTTLPERTAFCSRSSVVGDESGIPQVGEPAREQEQPEEDGSSPDDHEPALAQDREAGEERPEQEKQGPVADVRPRLSPRFPPSSVVPKEHLLTGPLESRLAVLPQ